MRFALLPLILCAGLLGAAEQAPAPKDAGPVTFAEIVGAALADSARLPAEVAAHTRYLTAAHLSKEDRKELYAVVSYHANGMSREAKIAPLRQVNAWLWAVDLHDYRWGAKVWEDLKRANSYFVVKTQVAAVAAVPAKTVKKQRQVYRQDQYGRGYYATEEYEETAAAAVAAVDGKEDFAAAPWLPAREMANLVARTGSITPIVRADQFLHQTAAQAERKGHGYYDFLALTKRADAEKLAGLDRKKAEEIYREHAAIINSSRVSPQNRQIFRYSTLAGGWWESRDVFNSVDKRNGARLLLDDYKHDAEEIVFTLPNNLPGYYLSDAQGNQVDTAPDTIAADHESTNNDRRVHVGYSCAGCHIDGGLKSYTDYARKIYGPGTGAKIAAVSLDVAKAKRLESVYLGPLDRYYAQDKANYGAAITEASGLKPLELAKAVRRQWSRYLDVPVTIEMAAAEAGHSPKEFREKLQAYGRLKGVVDPVLVGYLIEDPPPVRREHAEEAWPVLMLALGGYVP